MNDKLAAALQQAWPIVLTALQAALFIVSTVLVFIDEARAPALVTAFHALWAVMLGKWLWDAWRDWRKGLLSMPLSQLHKHIARDGAKRTSLLEFTSMLMGIAAMTMLTWH